MRTSHVLLGACAIALAGCQAKRAEAAFDPKDPVALAAIDSLMKPTIEGAQAANADQVLKIAQGPAPFTFLSGDEMLSGLPKIHEAFAKTYQHVKRQDQEILEHEVRLVAPDVALYTAVGEGTYTTPSGWQSQPTGIGLTVVLVKHDGRWQAVHAHQSIAP